MKHFLVIALLLCMQNFLSVESRGDHGHGDHEHKISETPGCEKFKDFKDIERKTCCKSLPEFHKGGGRGGHKDCDCKSKEKGEKHCCFQTCMLKSANVTNSTGFIDPQLMKDKLIESAENDKAWTEVIGEVVDECVKEGPKDLEKWEEKHPDGQCETALNMVVKHCIMRNIFFKCPSMEKTSQCAEFIEFGKGCELFPFRGGHKGHHH